MIFSTIGAFDSDPITLGFPKLGLFNFPGAEMAGKISIADIGIPPYLAEQINTELITDEWAKSALPKRPPDANKGSFGRVLVVAGSINYIGAAYLACSGAIRVGAGLVTLATPASLQSILASKLTEATYLPLHEVNGQIDSTISIKLLKDEIPKYNAILVGCGLGQSEQIADLIKRLFIDNEIDLPPVVLDADALNILANEPEWWRPFKGNAILTPHPGEMARLTGMNIEKVQQDRLEVAEEATGNWGREEWDLRKGLSPVSGPYHRKARKNLPAPREPPGKTSPILRRRARYRILSPGSNTSRSPPLQDRCPCCQRISERWRNRPAGEDRW